MWIILITHNITSQVDFQLSLYSGLFIIIGQIVRQYKYPTRFKLRYLSQTLVPWNLTKDILLVNPAYDVTRV
jgi:hypothetical protein